MTTPYTAEQLQAAYDRAYADVRREYAEDLPALLAEAGCKSVEELVAQYLRIRRNGGHSVAVTAQATRDALARLWLPTTSVLAAVERAAAMGCLDEESMGWLRRMQAEQRRRVQP